MRTIVVVLLLALAAVPAAAQPWDRSYEATSDREPGWQVLLLDPESEGKDRYKLVALEDLLAGIWTFPDSVRRYVALRPHAGGGNDAPTFAAADFTVSSPGVLTAAQAPPVPTGARRVWFAVATPDGNPPTYLRVGERDVLDQLRRQPGAITLNGTDYAVWRMNRRVARSFVADQTVFFDRRAQAPAQGDGQ